MPNLRLISPVRCAAVTCVIALIVAITWTTARPTVSQNHRTVQSAAPQAPASIANQVSANDRSRIVETYGKLPLSFEANKGQSDKQVKFLSRGQGYTLFLTGDEAVFSLRRSSAQDADRDKLAALKPAAFQSKSLDSAVLRMKLVGANSSAAVSGSEEQEDKSNYFIGNDSSQWRTNVSNYSKVRYQNAYPGVDLVYYGNQQQLEYDFVVAPGSDPRLITLDVSADSEVSGKRTT